MIHFQKIFLTFVFLTFDFLFISCSGSECAENNTSIPPEIYKKANEFIVSKTGKDFFNNHITPDFSLSKELESGYFMVYNFSMKEKPFISGTIRFTLDKDGRIISDREIAGIPECIISPTDCEFNIDRVEAETIARQSGLEPGIKEWDVKFLWNAQFNKYVWYIIITLSELEGGFGKRASGKEVIIDPNNGDILTINEWRVN